MDVLKLAALAVAASTASTPSTYAVRSFACLPFAASPPTSSNSFFSLQLPQHQASSSLERNKMNFPNHILLDAEIAKRRLKESLEPAGNPTVQAR